jgi:hypothetical protein
MIKRGAMISRFNLVPISYDHVLWPAVAELIRTAYHEHHQARLRSLPKNLVALVSPGGRVQCAAGLRDSTEPFLSECYLDQSIETVLAQAADMRVERREIVEVSGLACRSQIWLVAFLRGLIRYGGSLGFNWAFFTATDQIQKILHRIELPLIDLGIAPRDRMAVPELWGSYYESGPRVFAIGRHELGPLLCDSRGTIRKDGQSCRPLL